MTTDTQTLDYLAGTLIGKAKTLDEVCNIGQFNFDVEQTPLFTPEGEEVPSKKLLRRSDNGHVLGIVGSRYNSVDSKTMLEPFHKLVEDSGATYENAGVIGGGRQCWVSATLPAKFEVTGRSKDVVDLRVVCLIRHDGLGRNAYFSLANRLFCNNQIRLLLNASSKSDYSLTHTKNWEEQWKIASTGFQGAVQSLVEFESVASTLNSMKMTEKEMEVFMKHLYRLDLKKDLTSRGEKKCDALKYLFSKGLGNKGETRWDALNAVTEYLDHRSFRTPKMTNWSSAQMRAARQNRFSSNLNGYAANLKSRALDLLSDREIEFK